MKLLMYGVNKETVMKEDVEKYLLTETNKKIQMDNIIKFTGVHEIVVFTNDFRNEYYLYVDEEVFSHGDFLRYIAEETDKTLQEVILETYSKFNEDVLRHLFEVTSGYLSNPSGSYEVLRVAEEALVCAKSMQTSGPILYKMFKEAIHLGYSLKLEEQIKPLNKSELSQYIYLLMDAMDELAKKNFLISGNDLQVYFLTKTLLCAGAQTVTIVQNDEALAQKQFEQLQGSLTEVQLAKVFSATSKSIYYRLAKTDAAVVNARQLDIFDEKTREEVAIIRQTKKVQYLLDTNAEPMEAETFSNLNIHSIDSTKNKSYNEEELNNALVVFDEQLTSSIDQFMNYLQEVQATETKEMSY